MNLTIQEIAQAVGSECSALTKITNVEFDSRKITEGSLFVPLAGTRDGHESYPASDHKRSIWLHFELAC